MGWQPWKSSTGATSEPGKAIVSKNAIKSNWYGKEMIGLRKRLIEMTKRREAIDRGFF